MQILWSVLVYVVDFDWRDVLPPALYPIVFIEYNVQLSVPPKVRLKPLEEARIKLRLRYHNHLPRYRRRRHYRTRSNRHPIRKVCIPRYKRLFLVPTLRAAFTLLYGLVQPMHSVLNLDSAKIYRFESVRAVLHISDCLDASRREIPLIRRKPGTYLRSVTHKVRLAEVNVNIDCPICGKADQETV